MATTIDQILAEVCIDERVTDGIFDISNNEHMQALFENLMDNVGLSLNDAKDIHNKMLEGKYPERQAYNKDGLLVTFPTPQHKAKAISRGTHFEQDPTKGAAGGQNVFGGQQPATPQGQPPAGGAPAGAPEVPQQNIFPQAQQPAPSPTPAPEPASAPQGQQAPSALPPSATPPPSPAVTPSGPQQGKQNALPPSDAQTAASNTQPLTVEPQNPNAAAATAPNFQTQKSPEQKAAEAQVVRQMMAGNPNNPEFMPTVNVAEQRLTELTEVYTFAQRMGYREAMRVIAESMKK